MKNKKKIKNKMIKERKKYLILKNKKIYSLLKLIFFFILKCDNLFLSSSQIDFKNKKKKKPSLIVYCSFLLLFSTNLKYISLINVLIIFIL